MGIRINGQKIPQAAIDYELDRLVKFYSEHLSSEEIREQIPALKNRAREQAIGSMLLVMEARRLDLAVDAAEVERKLQMMKDNVGGAANFAEVLKRQQYTEDMVRASIEEGGKVDALIKQITAGISDPTEDELREHFEAHSREYRKSPRAQVQHVLIKPDSTNKEDRETAKSKLMGIRQRVKDGASFGDEAAAHSHCPSGQKTGGSLGWISRGMALPELDAAIFSLKTGELSEVVESALGFHILMKTAEEQGGEANYEDVAENMRDFLRHAKRGATISAFVAELREKAAVEDTP